MWSAAIANVLVYALGWLLCKYNTHMKVTYGKSLVAVVLFCIVIIALVYIANPQSFVISLLLKIISISAFVVTISRVLNVHPIELMKTLLPRKKN